MDDYDERDFIGGMDENTDWKQEDKLAWANDMLDDFYDEYPEIPRVMFGQQLFGVILTLDGCAIVRNDNEEVIREYDY